MISIPITAFINRVRGGGPESFPKWFLKLDGTNLSSVSFGLLCLIYVPWWQAILAAIGWRIGAAPSFGEEIGAIGGIKGNWPSGRDSWFGSKIVKVKSDRLWGWISGALRGLFFGTCIALPTLNPWFIPLGATFPLCYFLGVSIEQIHKKKIQASWHWAEWIFGAVLGAAFYG